MTETIEMTDDARLIERRDVRRRIGEFILKEKRVDEMAREIQGVEARIDAAAQHHREACEPLQEQLAAVEQRIVAAIADRESKTPADEAERVELLRKIADENTLLETSVETSKASLRKLKAQREKLRIEVAGQRDQLEQKLVRELGNPDLVDKYSVATGTVTWAKHRVDKAAEMCELNVERIAWAEINHNPDHAAEYAQRLRGWRVELEGATKILNAAKAEADALRQQLLDE